MPEHCVKFLDAETPLFVPLTTTTTLSQYPEALKTYVNDDVPPLLTKKGKSYIRLVLQDDLYIKFWITPTGDIEKQLQPCACSALGNSYKSVNEATSRIRALYDPETVGNLNTLTRLFYFSNSDGIRLLDEQREELFKPHKNEYESAIRIIRAKKRSVIEPQVAVEPLFEYLLKAREDQLQDARNTISILQHDLAKLDQALRQNKASYLKSVLMEMKQRLSRDESEQSWQEWLY